MKKIICFGDSNTFGFNPNNGSRYDSNTRWTGILAKMLGDEFVVAEEGCNNRTGFFSNPDGVLQSGQKYLPLCLEKHKNINIFIFALGTNDLQKFFSIDENIVREGLKNIINFVRKNNPTVKIILIPPVVLSENVLQCGFSFQFDSFSIKNSIKMQSVYENIAQEENCEFLNLNQYVSPSADDGLHFDEASHRIIAEKIADKISHIYGENFEGTTQELLSKGVNEC